MFSPTQTSKRVACKKQLSFVSPAKINLFFRVLRKREDGFHEIASLYQAISLFDTLHLSLSKEDKFTCSDPSLAMDDKNLVCKALQCFREKTGICDPVTIHLEKNIPMEAGLGGGSSNAATALWALSELFSLKVSQQEFIEMGSFLGSDVPFFFSSGTAYCTGRGEKLQESCFQDLELWIAKPQMGLSTPLVYGACRPLDLLQRDPEESLKKSVFYNDLELSAFSLCPELKEIKEKLLSIGFDQVVMSGSGTSFFCIGSASHPELEGIKFFQARAIQRRNLRWYEL